MLPMVASESIAIRTLLCNSYTVLYSGECSWSKQVVDVGRAV